LYLTVIPLEEAQEAYEAAAETQSRGSKGSSEAIWQV
jgi:hypothetical protein